MHVDLNNDCILWADQEQSGVNYWSFQAGLRMNPLGGSKCTLNFSSQLSFQGMHDYQKWRPIFKNGPRHWALPSHHGKIMNLIACPWATWRLDVFGNPMVFLLVMVISGYPCLSLLSIRDAILKLSNFWLQKKWCNELVSDTHGNAHDTHPRMNMGCDLKRDHKLKTLVHYIGICMTYAIKKSSSSSRKKVNLPWPVMANTWRHASWM